MILRSSSSLILRSGNVHIVNVPEKYWKDLGWELNDEIEVECTKDSITIVKKK
jgi:antitoxin component of MazEF toxin-antitoxin module